MADCNETIRELDTFLDGELSEEMRAQIHTHLIDCVDCHQAYDFHAELKIVIQRKCADEPMPEGLEERIRQCFDTGLLDPNS